MEKEIKLTPELIKLVFRNSAKTKEDATQLEKFVEVTKDENLSFETIELLAHTKNYINQK